MLLPHTQQRAPPPSNISIERGVVIDGDNMHTCAAAQRAHIQPRSFNSKRPSLRRGGERAAHSELLISSSIPTTSLSPLLLFPVFRSLSLLKPDKILHPFSCFSRPLVSLLSIFVIHLLVVSSRSCLSVTAQSYYNGPYNPFMGGVGFLGNGLTRRSGRYFNFYEPPRNEMSPASRRDDRPLVHDDVVQIGNLFLNPSGSSSSSAQLHKRRSSIASSLGAENDRRLHLLPARTRITLPGRLRAIIPFGGRPDQQQQQAADYAVIRRKRLFRQPPRHAPSPLTTKSITNPFILGPLISNTVKADTSINNNNNNNNKRDDAYDFHTKSIDNKSGSDCPTTYGNSTCVFQHDCPLRRLIYSASSCNVRVHAAYDVNALIELPGGVCCLQPDVVKNGDNNSSTAIALRQELANSPYLISIPKPSRIKIMQQPRPPTTTTAAPTTTAQTTETTTELASSTTTENSLHIDVLPSAPTSLQIIVEPAKQAADEASARPHRPMIAEAGEHLANGQDPSVQLPLPMPPSRTRVMLPDGSPQSARDRKIEAAFLDINQCGRAPLEMAKNHGRGARIIGGTNTHYGQWPYFALLLNYRRPRCGGALINDQYMVTAAHCVAGDISNYDLTVNLGDYDLRTNTEYELALGELPSETFNVRRVYRHPAFQRQTLRNDIALLRLDKKVKFKPHIQPVCLPQREYAGVVGTVLGLGKQNENDPNNRLPTRLKKVELPIINRDKCRRYFRKYDIDDMIMDMHICAGGIKDQDACQGDSGGPISVQTDQHSELVGLVSFGWGCGQPNVPGVYSNIFHFRDWIIDTVIDNMD